MTGLISALILSERGLDIDFIIENNTSKNKDLRVTAISEKNMEFLKILKAPILVGISRKSMIYKTLKISKLKTINGTTALNMYALSKGAKILRVHDVKQAMECIYLNEEINSN